MLHKRCRGLLDERDVLLVVASTASIAAVVCASSRSASQRSAARAKNSLRDTPSRAADASTRANVASGMEIAVFTRPRYNRVIPGRPDAQRLSVSFNVHADGPEPPVTVIGRRFFLRRAVRPAFESLTLMVAVLPAAILYLALP